MKLSRKCEYSLRALAEIAYAEAEARPGLMSIPQVARRTGIPERFLEQILLHLKTGQFLRSKRGVDGGYALARPASGMSLGEVVRYVDGPIEASGCAGAGGAVCGCPDPSLCPLRGVMTEAGERLAAVWDGRTVADLVAEARKLRGGRGGRPEFEI
jgi:Rrf2 family protein